MRSCDTALMTHERVGFPDLGPATAASVPFPSASGRSSPGLHSWKKTLLGLTCCNREAKNQEP